MKIKVLYVITKADVGGAQKYVADLARTIDVREFDPKILYGGRDIRWLSNKTYPWLLFANDWLAVGELVRAYRRECPYIIHLNSSKGGVIGALAAFIYNHVSRAQGAPRARVVFTAHGWVFNPTNNLNPLVRRAYLLLHRVAGTMQDAIITVSRYDHGLALRYKIAPPGKLVTIHNGIDQTIVFLARAAARAAILERCQEAPRPDPHTPWVGSLGRLTQEKNYETLIEAAHYVSNASFIVIGAGKERSALMRIRDKHRLGNRFFFAPPAGDDAKLLTAFDVFAMSSVKEGFPYVLLEAMAAELPIVVTRAGGIPEAITHAENGLIVPQRDSEALARAISELLQNRPYAAQLARNAASRLNRSFTLDAMARETALVYRNQIENR